MHIVTKILIVACAILSLMLSALAIAYTANATALKDAWKSEHALRIAADETARNTIQQYAQGQTIESERLQSLQNDVSSRESKIADMQQERTALRAELEKSRTEAASIRGQIGQLGVTVETQATMIKNYRDEVTTLRDNLLSAQKREIELVDRVNELEGAREVLQQNARALKEQLEETKLSLQAAQAGGASGARLPDNTPRELPGPLVRARVSMVMPMPSGETMVEINEGANRGIKPNAQMHVVRAPDMFIGSITITAVDSDKAVGRLTMSKNGPDGKPLTVQPEDLVLSRLTN